MKCKSSIFIPLLCLFFVTTIVSAQTIVAGNVSGTWNISGSPYLLSNDCSVPTGSQLIIEPGVEVVSGEGMALNVYGKITAIGTSNQPIIFRAVNNNVKFKRVYVENGSSAPPVSEFKYCEFRNAQIGLYLYTVGRIVNAYTTMKTNVYNCDFDSTVSTAMYVYAQGRDASQYMTPKLLDARISPIINGCTFNNNEVAIKIYTNGGGSAWFASGHTTAIIQNNIFLNITGAAVNILSGAHNHGNPSIINNTFLNCNRGVWIQDSDFDATTINNIFYDTGIAIQRTGDKSTTTYYNCFYNNENNFIAYPATYGDIVMTNPNGDSCDIGLNIYLDPSFADTNDYISSPESPCIDAGHTNEIYNDPEDPNNTGFALYPAQGTLRNDMGAYGGPLANIWEIVQKPILKIEPETIAFPTIIVGDTATTKITIKNTGMMDLHPSLVQIIGQDSSLFSASALSDVVEPNSAQELLLTFMPETSGKFYATLVIESDGGTGQVALKGEAIDPADAMKPRVKTIVDVPNDQGKQVLVCWNASSFDTQNNVSTDTLIQEYMCWRKLDFDAFEPPLTNRDRKFISVRSVNEMLNNATDVEAGTNFILNFNGSSNEEVWTAVGGLLATQSEVYSLVSPTLFDSTITEGIHWSTFFVSAHTANPKVWFASLPDSGYSVDNLAPEVPQGLMAQTGLNDVILTWTENKESDFNYYKIYRGDSNDFTDMTKLGTTDETIFHDMENEEGNNYYYRVTAIDFSGNESPPSIEASLDITGVDVTNLKPTEFNLEQNYPNPFNPRTEIHYSVSDDTEISLVVYDIQGRTIAELVQQIQPAGNYSVRFDGRKLATGLYFYRLEAGSSVAIKKMMLLK